MDWIGADDDRGRPSIHSVKYRKLDGTTGYKRRVSKSNRTLPGESKFKGNLNENHEHLFFNHDEPEESKQYFRIKIDLLTHVDGHLIDHTDQEYASIRWK